MAYALKYFWEKTVDNKVYRLEIHKKNSTSDAMEIGDVVQGLSLNIDGGEDNLDSPLLTSSLVMTFVDAYDHPESLIKKCGNWAEFYTPDATMWKVLLSVYSEGDGTIALWGGYVTPDSYEEDLTYGGNVTITARDNIGHLNDFSFDAEGDTITLRELVESAWAKIESPMRLTWANEWLQCDGVDAPDTYMNVSAFTGDTWHKAVEKALYGYGAVLRYKGENEVVICPLKSIPTVMPASSREQEPIFVAGATRLLTPAVKKIEESVDYEIEAITAEPIKDSDYTGETDKFLVEGYSAAEKGVAWNVDKKESGFGWCAPELSLFFNAKAYSLYNEDYRQDLNYMFLCCNTYRGAFTGKGTRYAEYSRYINASDVTFQMRLGTPYRLVDFDYLLSRYYSHVNYTSCLVAVKVVQNGITNYLQPDKTWGVSEAVVTCDISGGSLELPISLSPYEGSVLLCIQIVHIFTTDAEYKEANYAPVYSAGISIDNGSVLAKNNVNTVYSEQNNVVITRSPEIAPSYNIVALPEIIKNGIFRKVGDVYQPARQWAWQGFTPQQLAVYNHLQLLCYYAKPNNILEGTITNGDLSLYGNIWKWEGKEHILVAGRYDILTGYIDGAILREFARYENMWGDIGGVGFPDVEASSANRAEVGASSSSNPNTYTNTTTVNIGTGGGGSGASYLNDLEDVDVNGVVAGSVLWFDGSNWIDRSLSVMLEPYAKAEDLRKVLDWFTLEDDVLHTKYNIASDEEISAHGLNKGTGGGGGSSYSRLDTWDGYDNNKAGYVLSALLGYDLHSRVTVLENKEVDLSNYYTKGQTDNRISAAISKIDFTPYATNDALSKLGEDVQLRLLSSEFATWETNTFTPLAIRVSQAEESIDTNATNIAKANNNISTLDALTKQHSTKIAANEENIGTKADQSSLDAAVKDIATNAEDIVKANKNISDLDNLTKEHTSQIRGLDERITVAENDITNHDTEIDNLDKRIKTFESWFELVDGNIKTTFNFYSTKQISALGLEAGNGGGGSSYSRLDSWSAYDSSKAGYVLSALLGQDLNTRLIAVENKEVDLSGYYTKSQTDVKISSAVSAIDFTPYAKSADVAKTYATIAALNLIDGRVGTLEKAGYATTGYVDSAVSGIDFTPYAKKKDVADTYATKESLTSSINGLNISQYAKSSDVAQTYATKNELTSSINGLNMSQYATTAVLNKAISDLNISQYAKSTDVASTYATIAALNGLTGLHNTLRGEFDALNSLLNDDTAGVIDTWNEVVDFINEYSGKEDLSAILAGMNADIASRHLTSDFNTWVTNTYTPLANRVGQAESKISTHTNQIGGLTTRMGTAEENIGKNATAIENNKSDIDKLLGWFKIDSDGNVYTEHNFYSTQQISAKGLNAGGGSGSSYNRLDAWADYDSSKAGYVLSAMLGHDLHSRVTTLENKKVDLSDYYTKAQTDSKISSAVGAIDFSPYATKSELSSSITELNISQYAKIADVSKTYATKNELSVAIDEINKLDLNNRIQTIENSYISKNAGGVINGGLVVTSLAISGGSATQFIKADGSLDGTTYLSGITSSMVVSALEYTPYNASNFTKANIKSTLGISDWALEASKPSYSKSDVGLGNVENKSSATIRGEITSANVTNALGYTPVNNVSLANYLPLSGGTISGLLTLKPQNYHVIDIVSPDPNLAQITMSTNDILRGMLQYNIGYGFGFHHLGLGGMYVNLGGEPNFVDSANNKHTLIHSGNIGERALNISGTNARPTLLTPYENLNDYGYGYYSYVNANDPENRYGTNAALFAFRSYRGIDTWQIAFDGNGINNTAGPNFAIRGNFANLGWTVWYRIATTSSNVASATKLATARTIWGQSFDGSDNVNGDFVSTGEIKTTGLFLCVGTESTPYNHFRTEISLVNPYDQPSFVQLGSNGARKWSVEARGVDDDYAFSIYSWSSLAHCFRILNNGNVGIGTTDPTQKLHVEGNILATGEISANVLNQGSDIRFKDMISDVTLNLDTIANAPMFRFIWNNTDDKKVHIGSSAQYWKNYASELVSIDKDDFHRLDYSTLGVLIGVTLAKTTKNHEDRIKELEAKVDSLEQDNRRLTYGK